LENIGHNSHEINIFQQSELSLGIGFFGGFILTFEMFKNIHFQERHDFLNIL